MIRSPFGLDVAVLSLLGYCVLLGCSSETAPTAAPPAPSNPPPVSVADDRVKAEMLSEDGLETTRVHGGEFVYIAPDGSETVLTLGDNTVASISNTLHEGEPNEFSYKLQYLRHRDGKDLFEVTYQRGPNQHTTVGPFAYEGVETPIGNKGDFGSFLLRPEKPK